VGDTRAALVEAAIAVLRESGFASASARRIAQRAGCNQALVFYHFGSVNDLLIGALEEVSARRMAAYRDLLDRSGTLAELISGWGYRTETARDGMEAWEKALAWDPAIVVTDLKMPRMDGMGLLAKLAEGGVGLSANMAVVVLTAMGSIELAVEAMKLGVMDYMAKGPASAHALSRIVASAVQRFRYQEEIAEQRLLEERLVRKGDVIGIVAGTPMGVRGTTNFMKFHVIGGAV